jgi:hypothetical protein
MAEYDDIRDQLTESGYDAEPESSIGGTLLGIGASMAGFHFGMMGIQKISKSIGVGLTRLAAQGTGKAAVMNRVASGIRTATGGTQLARDAELLGKLARFEVGSSAMTGAPVKGMGAIIRDHPRVADSKAVTDFTKRMERPRAALNAWREQPGGVTGDYTKRISAMKSYFGPGASNRIIGSTEKYMSRYLQASPAVYVTDRALGVFDGHGEQETPPAFWNIPGNVWDYAKFTASFLPVDMAFSGVTKHGMPLLKAGAEHGAKSALANTGYDAKIREWMADQFSSDIFKSNLNVAGVAGKIGAAVDALGQGMSEISARNPILGVNSATGVRFEPIGGGSGERAEEMAKNVSERFQRVYQERKGVTERAARITGEGTYWGGKTEEFQVMEELLDKNRTSWSGESAHKETQEVIQQTIASYTQPTKAGFVSRIIGLEPAFIDQNHARWGQFKKQFPLLVEAQNKLNAPQHNATMKFYLGSGVLNAKTEAGQALIETHNWRFAALSKQLLNPIEKFGIGLPFYGRKVPVGKIFAAGAHSLIDAFSGPYGKMPNIRKLTEGEGYAIPDPVMGKQIVHPDSSEDAYFMMGQFYKRKEGKLINVLRSPDVVAETGEITYKSNKYFEETTGTPLLEFVGIDKSRHSRLAKLAQRTLGYFQENPRTLTAGEGDTWE